MLKKNAWVVFVFALLAALVIGCSGGNTEDQGQSPDPQNPAPAPAPDPVEVSVYSIGGAFPDEFERDYTRYIQAKFPHIKVNLITPRGNDNNRLDLFLTGGGKFDIIFGSINGFYSRLEDNALTFDMTDLIKKRNIDLNRFEPTLMDNMLDYAGGQIWGLPVTTTAMTLYYNKDIFDKFGEPYLRDGMTWEEVYEVSRRLTRVEDGVQYTGLAVSPVHSMRMNPLSVPFVNPQTGKSTFDDLKWLQILNPLLAPAEHPGYRERMTQLGDKLPYSAEFSQTKDLAIFGIFADWQVTNDQATVNWDLVSYPASNGVGSQLYPTYWGIASFAPNPEAAMDVVDYLSSKEFQMIVSKRGQMPVLQDPEVIQAFGSESISKDKNLAAAYHLPFAPISPKHRDEDVALNALRDKLVDLAMGRIDVNTALRQSKEEADLQLEALARK